MAGPSDELRTRVLPALLTAFGVTILSAGLLTYTVPVAPGSSQQPGATPGPSAAVVPTATPLITLPPIGTPKPTESATPQPSPTPPPKNRVATRVRIRDLGIDLAVVKGNSGYPYCNVAMYLTQLHQPGEPGATYIFAHARTGMFLPLLEASKVDNGASMLGKQIQVYTNADELHVYEIFAVKRHQKVLDPVFKVDQDQLWLQTSEGPNSTYPKLMVVARPLSSGSATHAEARPQPRPVAC